MFVINFSQIKNSTEPLTHIEHDLEVRPEFLERSKKLLYQAKKVHVSGDLFYNEPYVSGDFHVLADLVVPSSRSLDPVAYHEDFHFNEDYTEAKITQDKSDESAAVVKVIDDLIDLQTAIEDNLLLHIPITILTPEEEEQDIYPTGNGWSVISETEYNEQKQQPTNSAFANLKELLEQKQNSDQDKPNK
ncbi:DUF177 domain-containing protein [Lactobacillus sp. ESL0681]|uniref:DUF177 domain-containing protein n=1 Tax=Lactobacillus sp. ESL0681 TaxID=2983211 RepID=UPI0023F6AC1F|nr:DUF177 domain-containing protein [Lactobacillus sp. ESL0681]WEV40928.1 DUF177 domain-containing protein [Lactobacillus sp. ESL0681]